MSVVTATEARANLPDILDRIADGDEVVITRHGKPVAVVVRPDALRSRRASDVFGTADMIGDLLAAARDIPLDEAPTISARRAEELVSELYEERRSG